MQQISSAIAIREGQGGDKASAGALATQKAATRLLTRSARENDKAVDVAIAGIVGRPLAIEVMVRHVDEFGPVENIRSVTRPRGITRQQIDRIIQTLQLSLAPAPHTTVSHAIETLLLKTPMGRGMADMDQGKRAAIYMEGIAKYPADAAVAALSRSWRFFPSWAELEQALDAYAHRRRYLLRTVSAWQPWSQADERAWLVKAIDSARFDSRYFTHSEPERAARAKELLERYTQALEKLGESA